MYAVVRTGGKQYRVTVGDSLEVEKLAGDVGETVTLDDVLLISNGDKVVIGQPTVADAHVEALISGQYRGPKILAFRYRPKKRIRVRKGHRQHVTRLEVQSVSLSGEVFRGRGETAAAAEPVAENAIAPEQMSGNETDSEEPTTSTAATAVDKISDAVEDAAVRVTEADEQGTDVSVEDVVRPVQDAVTAAADAIEERVDEISDGVKDIAAQATDTIDEIRDTVTKVGDAVRDSDEETTNDDVEDTAANEGDDSPDKK